MANKNIVLSATVRGFHVYKSIWKPEEGEKLMCYHEHGNPYVFPIKVCKLGEDSQIVDHLLMEFNRTTDFILQRGVTVSANICGKHYRGSHLVQEGLEVPCQITVCMPGSVVDHRLLSRYETLLRNLYMEPIDEEIMGTFLSITNEKLREAEPPQPQRKKNKKKTVKSRDIRLFLSRSTERRACHDRETVVID